MSLNFQRPSAVKSVAKSPITSCSKGKTLSAYVMNQKPLLGLFFFYKMKNIWSTIVGGIWHVRVSAIYNSIGLSFDGNKRCLHYPENLDVYTFGFPTFLHIGFCDLFACWQNKYLFLYQRFYLCFYVSIYLLL